jgi:hypothetical protein
VVSLPLNFLQYDFSKKAQCPDRNYLRQAPAFRISELIFEKRYKMQVYTYSEARQKFAKALEQAENKGKVLIRRKYGRIFALVPNRFRSCTA